MDFDYVTSIYAKPNPKPIPPKSGIQRSKKDPLPPAREVEDLDETVKPEQKESVNVARHTYIFFGQKSR